MVSKTLADPFRRDALSKPVRHLEKYKAFVWIFQLYICKSTIKLKIVKWYRKIPTVQFLGLAIWFGTSIKPSMVVWQRIRFNIYSAAAFPQSDSHFNIHVLTGTSCWEGKGINAIKSSKERCVRKKTFSFGHCEGNSCKLTFKNKFMGKILFLLGFKEKM